MSSRVRRLLKEFLLSRGVLVRRVPPRSQGDPFADQVALLRSFSVEQIFDVGAYVGLTARRYHELFPNARIHCFEPVSSSFASLQATVERIPQVVTNQLAVSDEPGTLEIAVNAFAATSSRFVASGDSRRVTGANWLDTVRTETVEATTIDRYCAANAIETIDVLKLDIQGGETAALRGAKAMLSAHAIRLVYLEVLLRQLYDGQPVASALLALLESHGYRIYGVYDLAYATDTSLYQLDAILVPSDRSEAARVHSP